MRTKRITTFILCLALAFVIGGEAFFSAFSIKASAEDLRGSDVLSDLKQDYTFNIDNYPVIQDNTSLQLIQIAESVQSEILVYVYQPNQTPGKYTASSINISAALHDSLQIKNYYLRLIDYDGVFQKYVVQGLTVPSGDVRYYDVISIYRMYDDSVDTALDDDNDNTIDEVVYKVAKQYTMTNVDGGVNIDVKDTDVVEITDKFVGFVRYPDGVDLFDTSYNPTDSHFVAFSTDRNIEKLYEADVYFTSQSYEYKYSPYSDPQISETYGKEVPQIVHLNHTQEATYDRDGLFQRTYSWKRIQSITDFMNNIEKEEVYQCGIINVIEKQEFTDLARANLQSKQWVLCFAETELYQNSNQYVSSVEANSTIISNVSILRLKFETDGVVYNLGVIDNKQTGSMLPSNTTEYDVEASDWFLKIIGLLIIIAIAVFAMPFISPVVTGFLNVIWNGIKFIFNFILSLVTFPFRFIWNLFFR